MNRLIAGALYPFHALTLLARTPRLWRYVLVPIMLNLLLGVTLYAGLLLAGWRMVDQFMASLPEWVAFLGVFLHILLVIALLIMTGYVLVRFGVVLGSPWYSQLSNELELLRTGRSLPEESTGIAIALRDIGRALGFELQKLILVVLVSFGLLLLNFVPAAGQILATIGGLMLAMLLACLDFFDSPLERRRLSFRAKLGVIRCSLPASASFGLICFGLVSIPFLNLLAIPLCVAAGTLFFCDIVQLDT